MASGKLVFPVKFDLEAAVKQAMGDADGALKRLQTSINARPLKLGIQIENKTLDGFGTNGSIKNINKEMAELVKRWNDLSEAQRITNQQTGEFTPKAQQILKRYSELTAASESYARGLKEIVAASRRSADAEIRANQRAQAELDKRIQKSKELVAMLNAEEVSLSAVAAKRKYYQEIANKKDIKSKEYGYATDRLKALGEAYERLKRIMASSTGNNGKDILNIKDMKATLKGAESSIEQVKAKLRVIDQVLAKTPVDSFGFRRATEEGQRLMTLLNEMQRKTPKGQLRDQAADEKSYQNWLALKEKEARKQEEIERRKQESTRRTLEEQKRQQQELANANARITGTKLDLSPMAGKVDYIREKWQQLVAQLNATAQRRYDIKVQIDKLFEADIKRINADINKLGQDMMKVGSKGGDVKPFLDAIAQLRSELTQIKNDKITLFNSDSIHAEFAKIQSMTASMFGKLREEERAYAASAGFNEAAEKRIANINRLQSQITALENEFRRLQTTEKAYDSNGNLTNAAQKNLTEQIRLTRELEKATSSNAQEMQKARQGIEAWEKMRKTLSETTVSVDALNAKIAIYTSRLNSLEAGSEKWSKTALEIRRLSEELQTVNQRLSDFQQKAFKGLSDDFTKGQVERLTQLRAEVSNIDNAIHNIRQTSLNNGAPNQHETLINDLLNERIRKTKQISEMLKSAEDLQLERVKKINEETEKRRKLLEDMRAKEKAHDAAKGERRALLIANQRRKAAGQLTDEQKKRNAMLKAEENTINNITKKLEFYRNKLNGQKLGGTEFQKTAAEIQRLTQALEKAQEKITIFTGKTVDAGNKQQSAFNRATLAMKNQTTYLERLVQRMMIYASINAVGNLLSKIRQVTAQFELQRISLGAIIQDQNRANQLFSEIKQFALKSPISILDMTKYTKQVAAYRIETDKLFDTTKRLADISVGLGVDMGRIVLAYGQVRAATYLRAAEVRQFTEAGIPLLELLSEKLTKMNGEMVTTAQVMDLISKRGIDFKMVEEVFNDMTSAGGIFYNMQEKQGNTLYGLWAKIGDAASVMYDEIGNTGPVNSAMKGFANTAIDFMRNWKSAGAAVATATGLIATFILVNRASTIGIKQKELADKKASAATQVRIKAEQAHIAALRAVKKEEIAKTKVTLDKAKADEAAAIAEQKRLSQMGNIKAGFLRTITSFATTIGIGFAITAVTTLAYKIGETIEAAHRLKNKLAEIKAETGVLQDQSERNFIRLAETAVKAADGSKVQKDALDELNRTYKEMLPEESLKIENLRKMKGHYDELTQSVREYIAEQQKTKALNTISEEEGAIQNKMERKLRATFKGLAKDEDLKYLAISDTEIDTFFNEFKKSARKTTLTVKEQFIDACKNAGIEGGEVLWEEVKLTNNNKIINPFSSIPREEQSWAIDALSASIQRENKAIEDEVKKYSELTDGLGKYTAAAQNYLDTIEQKSNSGETFLMGQENLNMQIQEMEVKIKEGLAGAKIAWQAGWSEIVESVDPNDLNKVSQLNMEAILSAIDPNQHPQLYKYIKWYRDKYNELVPQDATVQQIRAKMFRIADSYGLAMDKMGQFLWDGKGTVEDHLKFLKEQIDKYEAEIARLEATKLNQSIIGGAINKLLGRDIDKQIEDAKKIYAALKEQFKFEKTYTPPKKTKNKKDKKGSDTRLQELQEINQSLEKINKAYNDLFKKEGKSNALKDVKKEFKDTLDYINKIGKKFNLKFDMPFEFETLQNYRDRILKVMKSLKNLKGGEKAILDFQTMIDDAESENLQKKIEEAMKQLAEKISRTKTAKEFFDKILSETGDIELAASVSKGIYGETGFELQKELADQIRSYFQNDRIQIDIPVDVIGKGNAVNYKRLSEFVEEMKDELGEEPYKAIKKIAEDGQKNVAKAWEGYFNDLKKTETYAAKRVALAQTTADKIAKIRADIAANPEMEATGEKLIAGLIDKEMKEAAKLEWEAFKGTPLYVQMFEDLEHASTSTLKMMKSRLQGLSGTWGSALDPTQLKEMQSRMSEITEQLRTRNPWKALKEAYLQYREATGSATLEGAVKNRAAANEDYYNTIARYGKDSIYAKAAKTELEARAKILSIVREINKNRKKELKGTKALTAAQQKAFDLAKIARGDLEIANFELIEAKKKAEQQEKDPSTDPGVIAAQERVKAAEEEVNITERVSEILDENAHKSKDLKESLIAAANQAVKFLNMAGDIAAGVGTVMETIGADEEDVQYWNDISEALGEISGGIEDIVNAAMSGDVVGAISSIITALPKMFTGFVTLFSANRIRKANKEIRRQQELLEELEYTYSRLEAAADKALGGDYVSNLNQQRKLLEAQKKAYEAQAKAEKSKGKKADKAKIKEYENSAREVSDAIQELVGKVSEQIAGTDLTSAARDFAQSWLDAYKEFGNTADAMSNKFKEMIQTMVVNSILAKVMERALKPVFDMIDNMDESDFYSVDFWKNVASQAEKAGQAGNDGAATLMKFLEQAGINMREIGGELTGISRSYSTASEESISALAAATNTQNYYMSQLVQEAVYIRRLLEGNNFSLPESSGVEGWLDLTEIERTSMGHLAMIERNTAETVTECRRIAVSCESQLSLMKQLTDRNGGTAKLRTKYS